jgi:hypothetical protein
VRIAAFGQHFHFNFKGGRKWAKSVKTSFFLCHPLFAHARPRVTRASWKADQNAAQAPQGSALGQVKITPWRLAIHRKAPPHKAFHLRAKCAVYRCL